MIDMKKFMTAIVSFKDKDIDKMLADSLEYLERVYKNYDSKTTIISDAYGKSAVSWAAYLKLGRTVEKFLDKGASPNGIVSRYDEESRIYLPADAYSPLCYACQSNSMGTVELLIDRGADVNMRWNSSTEFGKQAIHYAVEFDAVSCARALLEAGADASSYTDLGYFPLLLARSVDMRNLLLEFGADIDQTDQRGDDTVLEQAAFYGNLKSVQYYIKRGANVHFASKSNNDTVLHSAVVSDNTDVVKAVLDAGADRTIKTLEGKTPFDYAKTDEIKELVKC